MNVSRKLRTETVEPIFQSRTLAFVAGYALMVGVYSLLPIWKEISPFSEMGDLPSEMHAALSLVLGLLLVFRTNAAYARWWEARTLWGRLVNISRNAAVKISRIVAVPVDQIAGLTVDLVAFPYALRDHLRDHSKLSTLPGFEEATDEPEHIPGYLIDRIYRRLGAWKEHQWIDGDELRVLDSEFREFLEVCGGCERIRRTRVVRSYRVFARQCVALFLVTFPWGIVNDFFWWTVPMTIVTAYFMIGLETVAEHVEEPFGYDEDDLDLDGLCGTIDRTVNEVIARRQTEADSVLQRSYESETTSRG